ncbi:MAG: IS30 family transposase [Ulvibacter sp.]
MLLEKSYAFGNLKYINKKIESQKIFKKSMTNVNGIEMAIHDKITQKISIKFYFTPLPILGKQEQTKTPTVGS